MLNVIAPAFAFVRLGLIDHSLRVTSTVADDAAASAVSVVSAVSLLLAEASPPGSSASRVLVEGVFARPVAEATPIAEPVMAIVATMPAHPSRYLRFFKSSRSLKD